jgi:hypothetical protein
MYMYYEREMKLSREHRPEFPPINHCTLDVRFGRSAQTSASRHNSEARHYYTAEVGRQEEAGYIAAADCTVAAADCIGAVAADCTVAAAGCIALAAVAHRLGELAPCSRRPPLRKRCILMP